MTLAIETPRLVLRPWREADREPWVAMCADPRVMEMLGGVRDRARALHGYGVLSAALEATGYGWWVVEAKDVLPFAGLVALQAVPFEAAFTPAFEVGWRLVAEAWGRGYATEGARAAIDFAFGELDRRELVALTAKINLRSQRVMQRLGMTYDAACDFEHPGLPARHSLRPSVLYRLAR